MGSREGYWYPRKVETPSACSESTAPYTVICPWDTKPSSVHCHPPMSPSARQPLPPTHSTSCGRSPTRDSARSNGSPYCPIWSRMAASAGPKSSGPSMRNPRNDPTDFTGFTQKG